MQRSSKKRIARDVDRVDEMQRAKPVADPRQLSFGFSSRADGAGLPEPSVTVAAKPPRSRASKWPEWSPIHPTARKPVRRSR